MDILLDASAIIAVILNEPNREIVINLTENTNLLAPEVISFEIGNALIGLHKKRKISEEELLKVYKDFLLIPLRNVRTDIEKALSIACKYKIYAYDAYYLEIAYRLKVPLLTFDTLMNKAGIDLKIETPAVSVKDI